MKTLRRLSILVSLMSASFSFAGGSGGGGILASAIRTVNSDVGTLQKITVGNGAGILKAEYIRFLKTDRSDLVFEYGQANEKNELYSQTFSQRPEEFTEDQAKYLNAIIESQKASNWVELK